MIDTGMRPHVERFRWSVVTRTTGTKLIEDVNGLDTFAKVNAHDVMRLTLIDNQVGANGIILEFNHDVPVDAEAVFVRRRRINLGAGRLPGWTIIGHKWLDRTRGGEYFFFEDWSDNMFYSPNFNAV